MPQTLRLINGDRAKPTGVLARCHCRTHPGYLTKALIESHACLSKNCCFFKKSDHPYWAQLESAKQKSKLKRVAKKSKADLAQDRVLVIKSIYALDCKKSDEKVNARFLNAYFSAVRYAHETLN